MKRVVMVLFIVIIFGGTTTSFADNCGDVDNSGEVDILDVVYTINYKYKEGPEPDCGPVIGAVTDFDKNVYITAKIGDQCGCYRTLK